MSAFDHLDELHPTCPRGCGRSMDDCYEAEDGGRCAGSELVCRLEAEVEHLRAMTEGVADLHAVARSLRNTASGVSGDLDDLIAFAGGEDPASILRAIARLAEMGAGVWTEDDRDWQLICELADRRDEEEDAAQEAEAVREQSALDVTVEALQRLHERAQLSGDSAGVTITETALRAAGAVTTS